MPIIEEDEVSFPSLQLRQNILRPDVSVEYLVLLHFEEDSGHVDGELLQAIDVIEQFLVHG